MKKIAMILLATIAITMLMTACGSGSECPAYASVDTVAEIG